MTPAPLDKSKGVTASERYLAELGEKSFLDLWCYPNLYIDKKVRGTGQGKELCCFVTPDRVA